MLTNPLTLYYSVLNLTRASMAIRQEIYSKGHHGLTFKGNPEILACCAEVTNGTFSQYLESAGYAPKKHAQISLNDCLSRVIETYADYLMVAGNSGKTLHVCLSQLKHTE